MGDGEVGQDHRLIRDLEDWLLCKSNILRFSAADVDAMNLSSVWHFMGFELGQQERERREAKRREQMEEARNL